MPIAFEARAIEAVPRRFYVGCLTTGAVHGPRGAAQGCTLIQKLLMFRNPVVDFCLRLIFSVAILLLNLAF
jgi:hypothetical protein